MARSRRILPELPEHRARTSAGLSAEARPPAASSWCVPNTFRPAATDVHILHTGDVFPSASPQNTSCIAPPSQMVAAGRLPPARPFPSWQLICADTEQTARSEQRTSHEYTHHRVRGLKLPMGTTVINPVVLHVPVIEVKFQLVGVVKIVFHYHDEVVRFVTLPPCSTAGTSRFQAGSGHWAGTLMPLSIFNVPSPSNWKYRMV